MFSSIQEPLLTKEYKLVVADHKIIDPVDFWLKANKFDDYNNNYIEYLEYIMNLVKLNEIRLSEYDPVKKEWLRTFFYRKGQNALPECNPSNELMINIIQKNGFIPMLDGHRQYSPSYKNYLDLILPDIGYSIFNTGNSFHVYWHAVKNVNEYFKFLSSIILSTTPLGGFVDVVDLRWIAHNINNVNGGLRITANNLTAKPNAIVPKEIKLNNAYNYKNPFKSVER